MIRLTHFFRVKLNNHSQELYIYIVNVRKQLVWFSLHKQEVMPNGEIKLEGDKIKNILFDCLFTSAAKMTVHYIVSSKLKLAI